MDKVKIHSKLQKLLALSASDNEAEAALAMEKCKELMDKYGIRTIDVDVETNTANVSHVEIKGYTYRRSGWQVELGASIAQCFDGESITTRYPDGTWKTTFIASATELILIKDLYTRLRRTIGKMAKRYASLHEGNTKTQKINYAHGAVERIYWRLKELYNTMKEEDKALVVVKKESVDELSSKLFPNVASSSTTKKLKDAKAYQQGFIDGNNINLSRSVGSTQTEKLEGDNHG